MNKALHEYDYTEADEIAKLLTFENNEVTTNEKTIEGLNFVITGKLSRKRDDICTKKPG